MSNQRMDTAGSPVGADRSIRGFTVVQGRCSRRRTPVARGRCPLASSASGAPVGTRGGELFGMNSGVCTGDSRYSGVRCAGSAALQESPNRGVGLGSMATSRLVQLGSWPLIDLGATSAHCRDRLLRSVYLVSTCVEGTVLGHPRFLLSGLAPLYVLPYSLFQRYLGHPPQLVPCL